MIDICKDHETRATNPQRTCVTTKREGNRIVVEINKKFIRRFVACLKCDQRMVKYVEETDEQYEDRIKTMERHMKNASKDLDIIHEAYLDNFDKILQCEKYSREHFKLLCIENALNTQSTLAKGRLMIRKNEKNGTKR